MKSIIRDMDKANFFGDLYPYIVDDDITDVDTSGEEVWLTDCRNNRYRAYDVSLSTDFLEQFSRRVSNLVSKPFHKMNPVLEAETDTLRITIVHEDVCQGKRCICIRKSLPRVRLTETNALESNYAGKETMQLLKNCIKAGMNIVFTGNPGAGKTECARFFSNYIPGDQRVITLEDTPEWHFKKMNPDKDCIELTINKNMDYSQAIKTCMRLNPKWLFLAEARSSEVLSLIESFSTGVKGLTTLHTDDVRNVPDRIVNMAAQKRDEERLMNDIYTFIDAAVLIKRKEYRNSAGKIEIRRYIDQICFFSRENRTNIINMIVENGKIISIELSPSIMKKFNDAGIYDVLAEKQPEQKQPEQKQPEQKQPEQKQSEQKQPEQPEIKQRISEYAISTSDQKVDSDNKNAILENNLSLVRGEELEAEKNLQTAREQEIEDYLKSVSGQLSQEIGEEMTYRGKRSFI
jgi:pilus assembly protein CpaF